MRQTKLSMSLKEKVHDPIMERYVEEKRAIQESIRARFIEERLNKVIFYFTLPSSTLIPNSVIAQDLQRIGLFPGKLFRYSKDTSSGVKFEKDLQTLFQRLYNVSDELQVGQTKVYTNISLLGSDIAKLPIRALDLYSKNINEWLKFQYGNNQQIKPTDLVRQAGVQGKVDLKLPNSMAQIQYQYSTELQTLLTLLKGANITAKNYTNMQAISFGKANYFRALSSVLGELGFGNNEILSTYFQTNRQGTKTASGLHKAHIRMAYEVLGIGQYVDSNGQLQSFGQTDYLIVFNKSSGQVKVRSTRDIVRQYINKTTSVGMGTSTFTVNLN